MTCRRRSDPSWPVRLHSAAAQFLRCSNNAGKVGWLVWANGIRPVNNHTPEIPQRFSLAIHGRPPVLLSRPFLGFETETLDFRSRDRDRDRDLDKMNSSALVSRDHGLEI